MPDNKKIASEVVAAVGGAGNINSALHCMTRLRLAIKDRGLVDERAVNAIKGVLGSQWSGGQYQVIIGQSVPKVHAEIVAQGVSSGGMVDENLDQGLSQERLTPKVVGNRILDYLSGSMVPLIPLIMGGGLFRTIAAIIGPTMLGLVAADNPLYIFLYTTLYEASFYFLPIYLGYTAAKKLGASPVLGLLAGGVLIAPTVVAAAAGQTPISVYGLEIVPENYAQSVLPIVLTIPVLHVVEQFMRKHVPDVFSTMFTPWFTMIVVVPIELIVLAPLGNLIGNGVANALFGLADLGGVGILVVMAILGAFWQLFVIAGMHMPVILLAQVQIIQAGYDPFVFVSTNCAMAAVWGCAIGAFLRIRNKEERGMTAGYIVSALLGGVTEPTLFGVLLRWRRTMLGMFIGGAIGAVVSGLLGVTYYLAGGASNLLVITNYFQGGTGNIVSAAIGMSISLVVAAIVVYLMGFTKEELAELDAEQPGELVVE
ncbi:PTS system beta-glucosides-specific IIC component [Olsenella profusa DSM 13989]|uniref:PTS transporter subunit EIIC n=1 Tax=Olsenella profusa TaxID=138595 RepID=UPI00278409E3|nr:PTS transporter subunit EIIC [Olsenella profusa]MDP9859057.1 PTS system beta-glucosides-specific IIC component [Olsenella profusa DSM 13989]